MKNRAHRWIYLKTGVLSALTALIVARVDFQWSAGFALGSLLGLLNWFFLGALLIALTERRLAPVPLFLLGKVIVLGSMLFYFLPAAPQLAGSFLLGFSMFLLVCVFEALGMMFSSYLKSHPGDRPLPENLRTLIMGSSKDG